MAEFGRRSCGVLADVYEKSKPSLGMICVQFGFAGMNMISKVALNHGMSPFVLVFYRHAIATLFTAPFAYVLERKTRPKLTFVIVCEIFISGFLGATMNQSLYYAGLSYTSATFACALSNMLPALTFVMAAIFRLERVGIRSLPGQAKVLGTAVCVGGAMLMTLYKGIQIDLWGSPSHSSKGNASSANASKSEDLTKGSLLLVGSCFSWAGWFIMQARIGTKYSAQYSSTTIMCFLVTIQSALLTAVLERGHPSVWVLKWDVRLITAIYSGVVASGMAFSLMSWCIKRRGPLFATMFNPLQLIIVAIMSIILLHETLHLGGVIGAILIVTGLYTVLWGKGKDMEKVVNIAKKDSVEESVNTHGLSHNPNSAIANRKEVTNTELHGDGGGDQETQTDRIATTHIAIDCSSFESQDSRYDSVPIATNSVA